MSRLDLQDIGAFERNARICRAAEIYGQNLCGQTVLFVYGRQNDPSILEASFKPGNFAHLVGIEPLRSLGKYIAPSELYKSAATGELKLDDYAFTRNSDYCDLKLEVISRVFSIDTNARMIGDFQDGHFVNLNTDKLVGRQNAVLGLLESGDVFVPNTVINADIREVARDTVQVLATCKKDTASEDPYNEIRYVAKSLTGPQFDTLCEKLKHQGVLGREAGFARDADPRTLKHSEGIGRAEPRIASPNADMKAASAASKTRKGPAPPRQGRTR